MIDNSDTIGHYSVTITGKYNIVNAFQCPTLKDAKLEAKKIRDWRSKNHLTTTSAVARQLIAKERRGRTAGLTLIFGEPIILLD